MNSRREVTFPFLYGVQYYRAPTPARAHWAEDLARIAETGFNAVKFWSQWRWAHRAADRFVFDDLDELMELAARNRLSVTINTIFDVAPVWVDQQFPDSRMVSAGGSVLEPQTVACRQIGGYPGPCFNHPQALSARMDFLRATVSRFRGHPAMGMWDLWNEPEWNLLHREPKQESLLCYCRYCRAGFVEWLQQKYETLDRLNGVWGRCYERWDEVELPRDRRTFSDMIDWRLFQSQTLTREAAHRLSIARSLDDAHPAYLHPVPDTMDPFNAVTGVDDFAVARLCDCFGGTVNGLPSSPLQAVSAAQGRVCYNVESHLRAGCIGVLPRTLLLGDIVKAFVPQLGLGIRGFLYWQYRCETLGWEAPGWGLLEPSGNLGVTHDAAVEFWQRLKPIAHRLIEAGPKSPDAVILKTTANQIFHWCASGNLSELRESVDGFSSMLYDMGINTSYADETILREGLPDSVKLLILPLVYAMDRATADIVRRWVEDGGVLFAEGLTGCFDLDTGRHSAHLPGLGLAEFFDVREVNGCAAVHLRVGERKTLGSSVDGDTGKAFRAMGVAGNELVPLELWDGAVLTGRSHYAEIDGSQTVPIAALNGRDACVVRKRVGRGSVFYAGTQLGWQGLHRWPSELLALVQRVCEDAGLTPHEYGPRLRADAIETSDGVAWAIFNHGEIPVRWEANIAEPMVGLYSGMRTSVGGTVTIPPDHADLVVPSRWLMNPHLQIERRDRRTEPLNAE